MISPRALVIGLPTFWLSSWASSSVCCLMSAASLASERPRLPAAQFAQPLRSSNAFCAAATARSTSSRPPWGTVAITDPVAGSTTSNVCPSAASTVCPPMTICVARTPAPVSVVIEKPSFGYGVWSADDTPADLGDPRDDLRRGTQSKRIRGDVRPRRGVRLARNGRRTQRPEDASAERARSATPGSAPRATRPRRSRPR